MLPNYRAFSHLTKWGDFATLRSALDLAWRYAPQAPVDSGEVVSARQAVDVIVPDSEDFDSPLVSAAIDAGTGVLGTLDCCLTGNAEMVLDVASVARDTVDMFVQERDNMEYDDPGFEAKILADPLMMREVQAQSDDLSVLKEHASVTTDVVAKLRGIARSRGVSSIGITM